MSSERSTTHVPVPEGSDEPDGKPGLEMIQQTDGLAAPHEVQPAESEPGRRLRYRFVRLCDLETSAFDRLYSEMAEVMVDAAGASGDASWAAQYWSGREGKAKRGTCAYTVRDNGWLVGFMLFTVRDLGRWNCLLVESGFVRPAYQRRGIGFVLCARIAHRVLWRRPWKELLWVSELINPVILNGWVSRFPRSTEMVPSVFGRQSADLDRLAPELARMFFPDNDYAAGPSVLSNRTAPRPEVNSWSGDARIDDYFRQHMDPATGDSVFYVAAFTRVTLLRTAGVLVGSAWRMMDRRVRRRPPSVSRSVGADVGA
jgi:GNAT superfamily N-acetyltransferase